MVLRSVRLVTVNRTLGSRMAWNPISSRHQITLSCTSHRPAPARSHQLQLNKYGSPFSPDGIHFGIGGSGSTGSQGERAARSYFAAIASW